MLTHQTFRGRICAPTRRQRGMTLLEIMIVLAILAVVMGLIVGPSILERFREAKVRTTKLKVDKYAFEAYPAWVAVHSDMRCPGELVELSRYSNDDTRDAWGQQLEMRCGSIAPPEAHGFGVASAGEDGKDGTGDDVASWRALVAR